GKINKQTPDYGEDEGKKCGHVVPPMFDQHELLIGWLARQARDHAPRPDHPTELEQLRSRRAMKSRRLMVEPHQKQSETRLFQPCANSGLMHRSNLIYSITSSARASSKGGTVSPSTFAVLRLMTSSNLVGCSTGM